MPQRTPATRKPLAKVGDDMKVAAAVEKDLTAAVDPLREARAVSIHVKKKKREKIRRRGKGSLVYEDKETQRIPYLQGSWDPTCKDAAGGGPVEDDLQSHPCIGLIASHRSVGFLCFLSFPSFAERGEVLLRAFFVLLSCLSPSFFFITPPREREESNNG